MPRFTIRRKKNPQKLNVFFLDQNQRNFTPQKLPVIQYILLYFQMESTHYEGLLTTMIGYVVIAFSLVVLYMLCAIARLKK
jgi:hypothetical protein